MSVLDSTQAIKIVSVAFQNFHNSVVCPYERRLYAPTSKQELASICDVEFPR